VRASASVNWQQKGSEMVFLVRSAAVLQGKKGRRTNDQGPPPAGEKGKGKGPRGDARLLLSRCKRKKKGGELRGASPPVPGARRGKKKESGSPPFPTILPERKGIEKKKGCNLCPFLMAGGTWPVEEKKGRGRAEALTLSCSVWRKGKRKKKGKRSPP